MPLELASWERAANHALVLHTVGREAKAGEKSGRAFYFRFLGDSDREGFFAALRRAAYLRHRQVFLEACRVGDAYSVHQVGDSLSLSLSFFPPFALIGRWLVDEGAALDARGGRRR